MSGPTGNAPSGPRKLCSVTKFPAASTRNTVPKSSAPPSEVVP